MPWSDRQFTAMMDSSSPYETKVGGATTDMEMWPGRRNVAPGSHEEIKRNLQSRHITMIAIAGMIVRMSQLGYIYTYISINCTLRR